MSILWLVAYGCSQPHRASLSTPRIMHCFHNLVILYARDVDGEDACRC